MSITPSQILYLEHGPSRLYAEAIQIVESRHLCWARPTLLIQGLPTDGPAAERQAMIAAAAAARSQSTLHLYDLENCPDLIWPQDLFEIAYDLDFFALLVQLKIAPDEVAARNGHHQLNHFIQDLWQSQPQAFPTPLTAPSSSASNSR